VSRDAVIAPKNLSNSDPGCQFPVLGVKLTAVRAVILPLLTAVLDPEPTSTAWLPFRGDAPARNTANVLVRW
jgi:hypothetical protein